MKQSKIYRTAVFISFVSVLICVPVAVKAGVNASAAHSVFFNLTNVIICLALAVAFSLTYLYFIRRLNKMNHLLEVKNNEIETANAALEKFNRELEEQHDKFVNEVKVSESFHTKLIQAASDGISFYDKEDNIIMANDAFYGILGMSKEEYLKVDASELLHNDCRDYSMKKNESIVKNGFYEAEIKVQHKDGHYLVLSTKTVKMEGDSGEHIGSLTISRDISSIKETQQELIKAKEAAEASNRIKTSFLSNISHEIRTPLNSVIGFSNLLLMDDISREQKEEYVDLINSNSEKLLQIIGDIIDLSRLESSQIEISYDETSVNKIVEEALKEAKANIIRCEKPILLSVKNEMGSVSDIVFTDKAWLKRILRHLLDNAVKFTLEGEVELKYFYQNNDLVFSIRDTGIGINKENIERIFEEFNQEVSGHHRPFEGLGLGLTLAKQVLDKIGGRINVTSEKGLGSVFSFSIPYRPAGIAKSKNGLNVQGQLNWNKLKCLVVDDNKDVLLYLTRILLDAGIKAVTARSGSDAIDYIKRDATINMVLLDMQMPGMPGIEVSNEIRKIRSEIPIIAQTAFIFEKDKNAVLKAGCDACLVKPIRRDNLISVISSFTVMA